MGDLIAILGRPNVGKSALFNRIARRRIAIVHDRPGVTRDRITAEVEWAGRSFSLVDTGGIGLLKGERGGDDFLTQIVAQVEVALEEVSVILFMVSVQDGIVPMDREVAAMLRRADKPVLLVINKVDRPSHEAGVEEFTQLGFERVFPISAIHGRGTDLLQDEAVALMPGAAAPDGEPEKISGETDAPLKIALVGRPNVGKSSIINALTCSERVIVTNIPGTTRDAVDVPFEVETDGTRQRYTLIDTAGIRKQRRIRDTVEFFSVNRTEQAIKRCDLSVLVMDAAEGVTEQDKKICDRITEAGCACVLVVNKWDLYREAVEKARKKEVRKQGRPGGGGHRKRKIQKDVFEEFTQWVQRNLFFMDYAPVIFTSATEGFQLDRLLDAIRYVASQLAKSTPTGLLNRTLQTAMDRHQPPSSKGHRLKLYYATQVERKPPTFLLFVNRRELLTDSYMRFLIGDLRKAFGFEGCPIRLVAKPRPKSIEPVRRAPKKKARKTPVKKTAARKKPGKKANGEVTKRKSKPVTKKRSRSIR